MKRQKEAAAEFIQAICDLAADTEKLDNLECYLSYHFGTWLKHFANTPESMVQELQQFANIIF